jgi:hypothetical protein
MAMNKIHEAASIQPSFYKTGAPIKTTTWK